MGLLRTILIIVLVFYGIRFLSRYVLPLIFSSRKGDTKYKGSASKQKSRGKKDDDLGDYVDYEEVKD